MDTRRSACCSRSGGGNRLVRSGKGRRTGRASGRVDPCRQPRLRLPARKPLPKIQKKNKRDDSRHQPNRHKPNLSTVVNYPDKRATIFDSSVYHQGRLSATARNLLSGSSFFPAWTKSSMNLGPVTSALLNRTPL